MTDGAARRGGRVLLVEDDQGNREVEGLMLETLGYEVDRVSDGAAAVTAAAAREYDAILMDCLLPVMDGYEATAAIRAGEPGDRRVRIIGISVHDDVERCHEAGMDVHLAKPLGLDALADALSHVSPHAPADTGSVLDPAIVDQLRMLAQAGNPELLERLGSSFARATPERVRALRAAAAEGDAEAIAFNVHTIKGSAANLGAIEVVATCREIENAPRLDGDALEPLIAELERRAATAQAELARLAESG